MTDYPLLVLGSYETYQVAHIATYIADRLVRYRAAPVGLRGRRERVEAVRDLAGAATALGNAAGAPVADRDLPRPLDRDSFHAARELVTTGPRRAQVVALAAVGRPGFAVLGNVPGIGAVGAHASTSAIAEALRIHILTRPVGELGAWAVTDRAHPVPTLPRQVDLAAYVEHLDPAGADDRAVARNLRGRDRRTDAAIRGRFAGVDLDAAPVVDPPPPGTAARRSPAESTHRMAAQARRRRVAARSEAPLRLRQPAAAEHRAPTTSAGP